MKPLTSIWLFSLPRPGALKATRKPCGIYLKHLKIDPFSFVAHYHLGLILSPTNTQDAIAHFADAIRLNPEYGMAHYQLGVIYSRNNAPEKALHHYQEALKCDSDPELDFLHKNLADQLLLQGKTDEALSQMETSLRINPLSSANHLDIGNFLTIQGLR